VKILDILAHNEITLRFANSSRVIEQQWYYISW